MKLSSYSSCMGSRAPCKVSRHAACFSSMLSRGTFETVSAAKHYSIERANHADQCQTLTPLRFLVAFSHASEPRHSKVIGVLPRAAWQRPASSMGKYWNRVSALARFSRLDEEGVKDLAWR